MKSGEIQEIVQQQKSAAFEDRRYLVWLKKTVQDAGKPGWKLQTS